MLVYRLGRLAVEPQLEEKTVPTRKGYAHGTPAWVELTTNDVAGAKDFYARLFGWEYHDSGTRSSPYAMATRNGLRAAGIGTSSRDEPAVWSTYMAVDDAGAAAERITTAGGTLEIESFDVMDDGRMALATDPTGAAFGILQANEHFGAAIVNEHGSLNWNELLTDDITAALTFYSDIFGWTFEMAETPDGANYQTFTVGGRGVGGIMAKRRPGTANHWVVYFAVNDVTKAIATVSANGGRATYGPIDMADVGVFAGVIDPAGARFSVIQLANDVD